MSDYENKTNLGQKETKDDKRWSASLIMEGKGENVLSEAGTRQGWVSMVRTMQK